MQSLELEPYIPEYLTSYVKLYKQGYTKQALLPNFERILRLYFDEPSQLPETLRRSFRILVDNDLNNDTVVYLDLDYDDQVEDDDQPSLIIIDMDPSNRWMSLMEHYDQNPAMMRIWTK